MNLPTRRKRKISRIRKCFNDIKHKSHPYNIFWTKTITEGFDNGFFEHLLKEGCIKIECDIK